jgi:hypothetical protein
MRFPILLVGLLALGMIAGGDRPAASDDASRGSDALLVKASPAAAPCVKAALLEATGRRAEVETAAIGPVGSAQGADVVVAFEEELTRVIEGGETAPDLDVDVASIPWVFSGPGVRSGEVQTLARSGKTVRVFGGVIAGHARQSLEFLPPSRVKSVRDTSLARRLGSNELALVPLSLAGPGPIASADVPPLLVRALGVRASPRREEARAFLAFLTGPVGEAAFGRCGRDAAR